MRILYLYIVIGAIISVISYVSHGRKEKDIAEVIHEKLHELRDDGSNSFKSANIIGYLLAFIFGTLLWPLLIVRKVLGR